MIIVINSQGGLVAQQDEELHQGSSRFNTINLIAPFGTNVMFWANFELPDGTIKPSLQGALMTPSVETPFGVNTWKLHLDFPITQYSGQVKMQIRGLIGDVVACTTTVKFYVEKGVPYQSEYVEDQTTYDDIVAFISDLQAILVDKVNITHNTYAIDPNVTSSTVGTRFVYENGEYKSKTLPQEYQAGTTYYDIATTGIVGNNNNGLYLQMSGGTQTTKVEILKDKVVINGKTVIVVDDLIAENIAYDNTESGLTAENVQDAIDEVEARTDDLETRMTTAESDIDNLEANKEDKSNKVSSWSASPNNTRYPSEKLVKDNLDLKENAANKTNTISDNATQYASAKAVFDYAENKSNKVSSITIASTNIQYPTAKAVYDGLVLKEDKSNKVIEITQNSDNDHYPGAKAVYDLVAGFSGELKIEFVEELPQASAETWFTNSHTFYFLRVEGEEGNEYEEYVCRKIEEGGTTTYKWELIGSAQVDLSNYYTKDEADELLDEKEDKSNKVDMWTNNPRSTHYPSERLVKTSLDEKSTVSVSDTGTTSNEIQYITVDDVEWKLAGGGLKLRRLGDYDPVFANNSWAAIKRACKNNEIPETWEIGALKTFTGTDGLEYHVRLSDKQQGRYAYTNGGSTNAVFELVEATAVEEANPYQWNTTNTNAGGYDTSLLKTTVNTTILNVLPDSIKNLLEDINIKSSTGGSTYSGQATSVCKIFPLAYNEIMASVELQYTQETANSDNTFGVYDYYELHTEDSYKIKTGRILLEGEWYELTCTWWLRTAFAGSSTQCISVETNGGIIEQFPSAGRLISFAWAW